MDRQQKLALLASIPKLKLFPDAELRRVKTLHDAYYETIRRAPCNRKSIELHTGISRSHMSRILNGTRGLPEDKRVLFFEACGNLFAVQWEAYQFGLRVDRREITPEETVEVLQARVAELEQRVSA